MNEAVLNVQRAVSTKSSVPALEGILIKTDSNGLTLCGYDLELGMTTQMEANVEEKGKIVLSARLFGDIVRRLPAETVELSVDPKNITTIKSGPSEFSIVGIPAEEYPELPSITGETSIQIEHSVLKGMIRQTIFAVAESDAKPIHTGTLFELEKIKSVWFPLTAIGLPFGKKTQSAKKKPTLWYPEKHSVKYSNC